MAKSKARKKREDKEHLAFVKMLPCCVCKRPAPSDAHHILYAPYPVLNYFGFRFLRGTALKAPDMLVVPLCKEHHQTGKDAVHIIGSEGHFGNFWQLALDLYQNKGCDTVCYNLVMEYKIDE